MFPVPPPQASELQVRVELQEETTTHRLRGLADDGIKVVMWVFLKS